MRTQRTVALKYIKSTCNQEKYSCCVEWGWGCKKKKPQTNNQKQTEQTMWGNCANSGCTFIANYYPLKLLLKFASLLLSEVALSPLVKLPVQLLTFRLMAVICGRLKDNVNSQLPGSVSPTQCLSFPPVLQSSPLPGREMGGEEGGGSKNPRTQNQLACSSKHLQ